MCIKGIIYSILFPIDFINVNKVNTNDNDFFICICMKPFHCHGHV